MSKKKSSTAHDFWAYQRKPLDEMFRPRSVAVIGATEREGSVGRTIVWNLMTSTFGGTIYPINPKRRSVMGIRAYPAIGDVPETVDLAVIVVPAPHVPGVIRECVQHGVRGAIVISAGFKEIGEEGIRLEQEILHEARQGNMRIIGPNCLGVMSPLTGLNATFARRMAQPGSVGFISQSGAMGTAILDWSFRANVGFSAFVSIGSMLDVNWGDLIYYLGDDPNTKSIVIYMESIGNARDFLSAAREVALTKPIIVIKPGRTEAAARAAASHTGSMTGSDKVLDVAFRRAGVLRVDQISELFSMAELLAKQPRTSGPNLTIITNAGGPGVLATDSLLESGGELTVLSDETLARLDALLPPHWSHANPIDILGDATPDAYTKSIEIAAQDPNSDGLLVVLSPQSMTDPTRTAEQLAQAFRGGMQGKPLLASWMGGADVAAGEAILNQAGIPTYPYPDTATRMFSYLWQFTKNQRALYETPRWGAEMHPDRQRVSQIIEHVRQSGRTLLTEYESKQLLAAYGIPTVETVVAESADTAVAIARKLGYPVVLKLNSETITHKADVQGVQLNLRSEKAVREAYDKIRDGVARIHGEGHFLGVTVQPMLNLTEGYELILGASPDDQFGPVVLFGTGGTLVEVYQDSALALPPLNTNLARRIMRRTKIYTALEGVRGRQPVDLDRLDALLVNFSQLVVEQRWIKEIDINPLLASADSLTALDARVILYDADITEQQLPPLAIRPYPSQYEGVWELRNGAQVGIRPIRPEDEPMMVEFHRKLSEESVYMRFFSSIQFNQRVAHDRLVRICHIDYDREMALVVTRQLPDNGHEIIAAGRLSKLHGRREGEYSMLIADDFQRLGIGSRLLEELIRIGRDEKLDSIVAWMLPTNAGMLRISEKLGFTRTYEDGLAKVQLDLG
jgi:acetyltransferase